MTEFVIHVSNVSHAGTFISSYTVNHTNCATFIYISIIK